MRMIQNNAELNNIFNDKSPLRSILIINNPVDYIDQGKASLNPIDYKIDFISEKETKKE